jgi:hypothetical protein
VTGRARSSVSWVVVVAFAFARVFMPFIGGAFVLVVVVVVVVRFLLTSRCGCFRITSPRPVTLAVSFRPLTAARFLVTVSVKVSLPAGSEPGRACVASAVCALVVNVIVVIGIDAPTAVFLAAAVAGATAARAVVRVGVKVDEEVEGGSEATEVVVVAWPAPAVVAAAAAAATAAPAA